MQTVLVSDRRRLYGANRIQRKQEVVSDLMKKTGDLLLAATTQLERQDDDWGSDASDHIASLCDVQLDLLHERQDGICRRRHAIVVLERIIGALKEQTHQTIDLPRS
jgi:hypothetical protein